MTLPESTAQRRKKIKRPLIVIGGKPKSKKSVLAQQLAQDLGLHLIETEGAKPYYSIKNLTTVSTIENMKTAVLSKKEPIVLDSISELYRNEMRKHTGKDWGVTNIITNSVLDIVDHMHKFGGIIVSHGKMVNNDYTLHGNIAWQYKVDAIFVMANSKDNPLQVGILSKGRHVPEVMRMITVQSVDITRNDEVVNLPKLSGDGYNYIKKFMSG